MTQVRELLELAAKSIGYSLIWTGIGGDLPNPIYFDAEGITTGETWNPLTDDGDALRLAVKLGIKILPYPVMSKEKDGVIASRRWFEGNDNDGPIYGGVEVFEVYGDDKYAATRLAITRAAAAIGKAMQESEKQG